MLSLSLICSVQGSCDRRCWSTGVRAGVAWPSIRTRGSTCSIGLGLGNRRQPEGGSYRAVAVHGLLLRAHGGMATETIPGGVFPFGILEKKSGPGWRVEKHRIAPKNRGFPWVVPGDPSPKDGAEQSLATGSVTTGGTSTGPIAVASWFGGT